MQVRENADSGQKSERQRLRLGLMPAHTSECAILALYAHDDPEELARRRQEMGLGRVGGLPTRSVQTAAMALAYRRGVR